MVVFICMDEGKGDALLFRLIVFKGRGVTFLTCFSSSSSSSSWSSSFWSFSYVTLLALLSRVYGALSYFEENGRLYEMLGEGNGVKC